MSSDSHDINLKVRLIILTAIPFDHVKQFHPYHVKQ